MGLDQQQISIDDTQIRLHVIVNLVTRLPEVSQKKIYSIDSYGGKFASSEKPQEKRLSSSSLACNLVDNAIKPLLFVSESNRVIHSAYGLFFSCLSNYFHSSICILEI